MAGDDFRDAQPSVDENGRPDATFILTRNAGDRFYQFTSTNIGKSLAVVLDNRVQEAANIQQAIRDQGRITGLGKDKAQNLSLMLRTGALPASIHYLQESVVGPSLGADSIRKGVMASVIGMLAVMIFMLIYYHGAGINADLASDAEPDHPAGLYGLFRSNADLAWNRRRDPDHRYGRRLQRTDLRAHPGRTACRQGALLRPWIRDLPMPG